MGVSFFITFKVKQKPQITSITPPIGAPGDLVIIKGKDFGENKNTNYVQTAQVDFSFKLENKFQYGNSVIF